MLRFTRKPSSGGQCQYLAKITHLVKSGYVEFVQDVSMLWLHIVTLTQCTVHTPHRSQYCAITLTTSCTASTYLLLTKCVIFKY